MHAAILHRYTGDPEGDLESRLGQGFPAADVERTQYLDGHTMHHGTLAARVTSEERVPAPGSDVIAMKKDEVERRVATDFYADFTEEWVGASTSTGGDVLTDYLLSQVGVVPEPSQLRAEAWAERLEQDDAAAWGASFSQRIEDGDSRDAAGAHYHDEVDAIPHGLSAVGFEYLWDGVRVRGTLAESGYVAVYNLDRPEVFARWVADEITPYLEVDRGDGQASLTPACERCGHDRDLNDDGYCITCQDYLTEHDGGEA
jgi:hypothetical protein